MKFLYKNTAQISEDTISKNFEQLLPYIKKLKKVAESNSYEESESSINLPFDEEIIKNVVELKEKVVSKKLKYIIDIGIGGSNLGTKAVYDTLLGYTDLLETKRFPKIIFADTNDPDHLAHIQAFLLKNVKDPEEVLINVISKSGGTIETIANLEIIVGCVKNYKSRLVVTTGSDSKLEEMAKKEGVPTLSIPEKVGGRYSVLTSVGLFPLVAAGLDVLKLLEGAMSARQAGISEDINTNHAAISAILIAENYTSGKSIHDTFFFHPELESVGKWYRQLVAESLGKEGKGITPTVSVGSTDLHSMAQLYLGGPRDKFFTFVWGEHQDIDVSIPSKLPLPAVVDVIKDKSAEDIMTAIYEGVKKAYTNAGLPFCEFILDDIDETALGEFLQFKMLETMYLGNILKVNAFDQPNVESYKLETKSLLEK